MKQKSFKSHLIVHLNKILRKLKKHVRNANVETFEKCMPSFDVVQLEPNFIQLELTIER
jgi:hypothetical protein